MRATHNKWVDRGIVLAAGLVLLVAGGADFGWNQWRGPTRDGIVGAEPWPDGLDQSRVTRLWRVELGPG